MAAAAAACRQDLAVEMTNSEVVVARYSREACQGGASAAPQHQSQVAEVAACPALYLRTKWVAVVVHQSPLAVVEHRSLAAFPAAQLGHSAEH